MKLNVESPAARRRHQSPAARPHRAAAGRRPENRRHGAQLRSGASSYRSARLRGPLAGHSLRRLGAVAEPRDHRRQPPAAHALRLLPRPRDAVQQARAGHRLRRHRRTQSQARDPRHERTLHRHEPFRHVRGDGCARSHHLCDGPRAIAPSRLPIFISCPAILRTRKPSSIPAISSRTSSFRRPCRAANSLYLKLRDRASYEFALASAAVVSRVANGKITRARIGPRRRGSEAMAHRRKPRPLWKASRPRTQSFRHAAEAAVARRPAAK